MTREIKFKFVNTNTNIVFNTVDELYSSEDWDFMLIEELMYDIMFGIGYPNIKKLQYTGLKDKNGVEIYEGDIIFDGGYRLVIFERGRFASINKDWIKDFNKGELVISSHISPKHTLKVGNIYQNPELLK